MMNRGGSDLGHSVAEGFRPDDSRKEHYNMWRAFFLAIGMFLLVLGAECMAIDQATLANPGEEEAGPTVVTVTPQDWVPWSLVSAGAVTMLYSYTLPQKFKG
jgi:hypothetical protein